MTEDRVFRNHPSVILRNVISACVFIGLIIVLNMGSSVEDGGWVPYVALVLVVVAAAVAVISYYIWRKTTYTFTSEEIVIRVGILTSNFHELRAKGIARHVGLPNVSGISAKSDPVLFVHFCVRECFAILKDKFVGNM